MEFETLSFYDEKATNFNAIFHKYFTHYPMMIRLQNLYFGFVIEDNEGKDLNNKILIDKISNFFAIYGNYQFKICNLVSNFVIKLIVLCINVGNKKIIPIIKFVEEFGKSKLYIATLRNEFNKAVLDIDPKLILPNIKRIHNIIDVKNKNNLKKNQIINNNNIEYKNSISNINVNYDSSNLHKNDLYNNNLSENYSSDIINNKSEQCYINNNLSNEKYLNSKLISIVICDNNDSLSEKEKNDLNRLNLSFSVNLNETQYIFLLTEYRNNIKNFELTFKFNNNTCNKLKINTVNNFTFNSKISNINKNELDKIIEKSDNKSKTNTIINPNVLQNDNNEKKVINTETNNIDEHIQENANNLISDNDNNVSKIENDEYFNLLTKKRIKRSKSNPEKNNEELVICNNLIIKIFEKNEKNNLNESCDLDNIDKNFNEFENQNLFGSNLINSNNSKNVNDLLSNEKLLLKENLNDDTLDSKENKDSKTTENKIDDKITNNKSKKKRGRPKKLSNVANNTEES